MTAGGYAAPVMTSSAHMVYLTPEAHLDMVREVGQQEITIDPCTEADNPTRARYFYSRERPLRPEVRTYGWLGSCGLEGNWPKTGLLHVNPPFGAHLDGAVRPDADVIRRVKGQIVYQGKGKGWAHRIALHCGAVEMRDQHKLIILPGRMDTRWFDVVRRFTTLRCEHRGRYKFAGTPHPAPFPIVTFYHGPDPDRFARIFQRVGEIVKVYRP